MSKKIKDATLFIGGKVEADSPDSVSVSYRIESMAASSPLKVHVIEKDVGDMTLKEAMAIGVSEIKDIEEIKG